MRYLSPGSAGWVAVSAVVVAAEALDDKTMSEAFRAASKHPVYGPVIFGAWFILTAHLFGFIPRKYDPISLFWAYTILKRKAAKLSEGYPLDVTGSL